MHWSIAAASWMGQSGYRLALGGCRGMRTPMFSMVLVWVGSALSAGAAPANQPALPELKLDPIVRVQTAEGEEVLAARGPEGGRAEVAFLAARAPWTQGLVPVFAVELRGEFQLRRRPLRGQENFTEPFFFALPPEDEPDAARIAGRWQCRAVHANGARDFFAWEFAAEGVQVAGRFDQETDFRFAHITGGGFQSNRFELVVEYGQERYSLQGEMRGGRLAGSWRHAGEEDHGTWEAERPAPAARPPAKARVVPLYEWRREEDGQRRWSVAAEFKEPGWQRLPRPLCRVWAP